MTQSAEQFDVVVVGAGFAGIYAIHRFRDQQGLRVQGFEAADDVGGTWYWNRYPGARVDIESDHYSYSFSEELEQEWHWTEKFAAQPEILSYLNHVADRFDVRRSIRFGTRVTAVTWDDDDQRWHVSLDTGDTVSARFFVSAAGTLSVPKEVDIPGATSFAGQLLQTGRWPDSADLAGKRVAVIGTGSSGIQVTSEVAKIAESLTVFQRTPAYATPVRNEPTDSERERETKAQYRSLREQSRNHFVGVPYSDVQPSALAATDAERAAVYDDRWARGGFRFVFDSFQDVLFDPAANETAAQYIRDRIRERVHDPATAELLTPKDYPYGSKRPTLEIDYYDAFNRPNVSLVDVKANPIDRIVSEGVRLVDGTVLEFDAIVLATGFDAFTGPLFEMGVVGRDGLTIQEAWRHGPATYLGVAVHGFPNLFLVTGPQSPSVLYNMPLAIEDHVDFAAGAISHVLAEGAETIEPTDEAQEAWVARTNEVAERTVIPLSTTSWYMGANVPGKPRRVLVYLGGVPDYRQFCADVEANGYDGFAVASAVVPAV